MCEPILVSLLKLRSHDSQSDRENLTQSSGTSPLASYKEVTLPEVNLVYLLISQLVKAVLGTPIALRTS